MASPKHAAIRALQPLPLPGRAPRTNSKWVNDFRELIRPRDLIARLQAFALDDPDAPKSKRMTRTQAMVALSLLRKCVPDLQALEIAGNSEKPLQIQIVRFSDSPLIDLEPVNLLDAAPAVTHDTHKGSPKNEQDQ